MTSKGISCNFSNPSAKIPMIKYTKGNRGHNQKKYHPHRMHDFNKGKKPIAVICTIAPIINNQ